MRFARFKLSGKKSQQFSQTTAYRGHSYEHNRLLAQVVVLLSKVKKKQKMKMQHFSKEIKNKTKEMSTSAVQSSSDFEIVPLREEHYDAVLQLNATFVHYLSPMDSTRLQYLRQRAAVQLVAVNRSSCSDARSTAAAALPVLAFLLAFAQDSDYDSVNYQWFQSFYRAEKEDDSKAESAPFGNHHSNNSKGPDSSFLYIDRVVVAAAAQGCGLGKALYRACEEWVLQHQPPFLDQEMNRFVRLCCEVDSGNQPSLGFHDKLSFAPVGSFEQNEKTVTMLEKRIRCCR